MTEITDVSVQPLDLELDEPFEISLGVQETAANVLVTVETESGTVGYGEGSPVAPVTGETQHAAVATAKAAGTNLVGEPVEEYDRLVRSLRRSFSGMVSATFAVETAILDAYCRERVMPLTELFGRSPHPVETDLTIPIVPSEKAATDAVTAIEAGFTHLKLKTGDDLEADIERTQAVADAVPNASLKIDANQGWNPTETVAFANAISERDVRLELIEQPVAKSDLVGLRHCREAVDVPIAADEAVFSPEDALTIVREEAADILNIKLGKSGLLASADIVSIARSANLDLMIGCMLESGIGIHTGAHFVAGTGAFSYVDLDANQILAEDVISATSGPIHDIDGPGHGVVPSI
jgi:L-alanine-DL-glutamate epimerase-like enolase superfamily enzyme